MSKIITTMDSGSRACKRIERPFAGPIDSVARLEPKARKAPPMKPTLFALALALLSAIPAAAQQQDTITGLLAKGYEIKTAVGPYIVLQKDGSIYLCSANFVTDNDLKSGIVPASKIACGLIK